MSLRVISGSAGTGKTTRLLALMDEWLASNTLREGQHVLALTFMHGSRMRLAERLRLSRARGRFECVTFDSFARNICARWRTKLAAMGTPLLTDDDDAVYDATCNAAAGLLSDDAIARWVAAAHPLIIVDEFQDCYGARPRLVERLSLVADVLVAADHFQDLRATGVNPAMEAIARAGARPEELSTVHRTSVPVLLAAATALRSGAPIAAGSGLEIIAARSRPLAASQVCLAIVKSKATSVVLSGTRPTSTNFPGVVINLVETTKGYGKNGTLGPYKVPWESSPDAYRESLLSALLPDDAPRSAVEIVSALPSTNPLSRSILEWLERERRLRGRSYFSAQEIRRHVRQAESLHRAFPRYARGLRALTIHQAKNREFQCVIVLWSLGVPSDEEIQRRWLYNAITRAQQRAWIIVEDPKGDRLRRPPFA